MRIMLGGSGGQNLHHKGGFSLATLSESESYKRSRKSAYDLVKIKHRSTA